MERTKYNIIALFMIFFVLQTLASPKDRIFHAYTTDNMSDWKQVVDSMSCVNTLSNNQKLELLNYQYGYMAWCIAQKKEKEFDQVLDQAENNLETLLHAKYSEPECFAYQSILLSFKIAKSPLKAPFLGPKSLDLLHRANNKDSLHWFVHLQIANSLFYRPKIFGGSKESAIEKYEHSLQLIEAQGETFIKHNWNYLNLLTSIATAYLETKRFAQAQKILLKAIQITPEFQYPQELLKQCQK